MGFPRDFHHLPGHRIPREIRCKAPPLIASSTEFPTLGGGSEEPWENPPFVIGKSPCYFHGKINYFNGHFQ